METIKIAHLYYDLMNLYGEHGNILALTHHLENHKVRVITHYLSVEDNIDFSKYDIFYIGSGNKENFLFVLDNMLKHKSELIKSYKENKFFIVTGNALNFFGKAYYSKDDIKKETLGLFNYEAHETDFRIVGETVATMKNLQEEIIGFQNRSSVLKFVKDPHLFDIKSGTGYQPKSPSEGIHKNNFYGTYILGPILIRNPYFTEYLVKQILKEKKIEYQEYQSKNEIRAYNEYKKNLLNEDI